MSDSPTARSLVETVARALEDESRRIYRSTDVEAMLPDDWEPWRNHAQGPSKPSSTPLLNRATR